MHEYEPKHTQGFGWKISVRPLGRPTHRQEDNIKTDFKIRGWKGIWWINLGLVRDQRKANMVINLWVTQDIGNCTTSLTTSRPFYKKKKNCQLLRLGDKIPAFAVHQPQFLTCQGGSLVCSFCSFWLCVSMLHMSQFLLLHNHLPLHELHNFKFKLDLQTNQIKPIHNLQLSMSLH